MKLKKEALYYLMKRAFEYEGGLSFHEFMSIEYPNYIPEMVSTVAPNYEDEFVKVMKRDIYTVAIQMRTYNCLVGHGTRRKFEFWGMVEEYKDQLVNEYGSFCCRTIGDIAVLNYLMILNGKERGILDLNHFGRKSYDDVMSLFEHFGYSMEMVLGNIGLLYTPAK